MKRKDLEDLGLNKEQVDKIMDWNGADIESEKAKTTKVEGERDNYKSQLDTATEQLGKLQDDLKAKDDEYAVKEADRVFNDALKDAINAAGGRNTKAVMALLDIDALKQSKDQTADIKKALDTAKESDAYLFGADEPINNPVGPTGGSEPKDSNEAMMRAVMGLPDKEK